MMLQLMNLHINGKWLTIQNNAEDNTTASVGKTNGNLLGCSNTSNDENVSNSSSGFFFLFGVLLLFNRAFLQTGQAHGERGVLQKLKSKYAIYLK